MTAAVSSPKSNLQAKHTDLIDLFGMLRRRKWHLLVGLSIGLALAILYYGVTPPTYRAKMEILVGQKSGAVARGASSSASTEGVANEEDILSTHIELITSRRIVQAAIDNAGLAELPSMQRVIEEEGFPLVEIQDNLKVVKGGDGVARDAHTLKATYDDPSPADCAVILRAVYDEYRSFLQEHFEKTSSEAVGLLDKLVQRESQAVADAESELMNFMGSTDLLWDEQQSRNIHKTRLESIEQSLVELTEREAETRSRLGVITAFLESKDPGDITDFDRLALLSEKEVERLQLVFNVTSGDVASEAFQADQPIRQETARAEYNEYLNLVMKEKKLREIFSDDHPSVISIQEQIALMRRFIDENMVKDEDLGDGERMKPSEMLETYVGLLKHDLTEIEKRHEVLIEKSRDELVLAKGLESHEIKADSLYRALERQRDIYQRSKSTLSELDFVRDYAGFTTDILGDAVTQNEPAWPILPIVLAIGVVFGGLIGLGLALTAELFDATFADPEDLSHTLGVPVYAHVPRFPAIRRRRKDPALELDPSVYVYHRPRSPEAEMYRVTRTNLFVDTRMTGESVIQVTSASPNDGKSTTSVNLAVAIADTGKSVLLVDGDLRRPGIAKLMRLDSSPGLTDILTEKVEPNDAVQSTIVDKLSVVTAGSTSNHPAELLESERLMQLVEMWKEKYDYVVIDSPPVLAVSDASILARAADAVLLTVRIVKKGRRTVERAKHVLDAQRIHVLGTVVNEYSPKSKGYGYANGYDKDLYGYGYVDENAEYYKSKTQVRSSSEGITQALTSSKQVGV